MPLDPKDQLIFAIFAATVDVPSGSFGDSTGTSRATIHPLLQLGRRRNFGSGADYTFEINTKLSTRDAYDQTISWTQVQLHAWGVYLVDGSVAPVPVPTWKPDPEDAIYLRTTTIGKAWPWGRHTGLVYVNTALTNSEAIRKPFANAGGWPTKDWLPAELIATAYSTGQQYLGFRGQVESKVLDKLHIKIFQRGKNEPAATLQLTPASDADMDPHPPASITVAGQPHTMVPLTAQSNIDDTGYVLINIERLIKHPVVTERALLISTPKLPFWLEQ